VLYAKAALLEAMPPFLGGGDMIAEVSFERSVWAPIPGKFEAGTPPIVEAIGLHAAIDYVGALGWAAIEAHERALVDRAMARLPHIEGRDAARPRAGSRRRLRLRARHGACA
jgi:cysteine desulfurase/selenocysteine lyase